MFPEKSNILKFEYNFEKASKIYKFKNSKIFVQMFDYYNKIYADSESDSEKVEKTINSFNNLSNLFNEKK